MTVDKIKGIDKIFIVKSRRSDTKLAETRFSEIWETLSSWYTSWPKAEYCSTHEEAWNKSFSKCLVVEDDTELVRESYLQFAVDWKNFLQSPFEEKTVVLLGKRDSPLGAVQRESLPSSGNYFEAFEGEPTTILGYIMDSKSATVLKNFGIKNKMLPERLRIKTVENIFGRCKSTLNLYCLAGSFFKSEREKK